MIERLFLVRHGETVHNVAGITQGWSDSALSDRGEQQVRALAARLRALGVTAIYSSPLGRAISTAEAIANETGLPINTHDDLREMNYGGWEGKSFLDVRRDDAGVFHRWIADGDAACPEGESHADVRRRFERALAAVDSARPLIVSHGTAIRIAATALLDLPVMASRHFAQDNAALNIFVHRNERWVLKTWNDNTHCGKDER